MCGFQKLRHGIGNMDSNAKIYTISLKTKNWTNADTFVEVKEKVCQMHCTNHEILYNINTPRPDE